MDFHRPETLAEALAIKAERPGAAPLAGDTDLMVAINFREAWRDAILDVTAGEPRSGGTAARRSTTQFAF